MTRNKNVYSNFICFFLLCFGIVVNSCSVAHLRTVGSESQSPEISEFTPIHGSTRGGLGELISIEGRHFSQNSQVWVGSTKCDIRELTREGIQCELQASDESGLFPITVVSDHGESTTSEKFQILFPRNN